MGRARVEIERKSDEGLASSCRSVKAAHPLTRRHYGVGGKSCHQSRWCYRARGNHNHHSVINSVRWSDREVHMRWLEIRHHWGPSHGWGVQRVVREVLTKRGIIIIIIPLLTLSADQIAKFICGDQRYGTIEIHHMDKMYKESYEKYRNVLYQIKVSSKILPPQCLSSLRHSFL